MPKAFFISRLSSVLILAASLTAAAQTQQEVKKPAAAFEVASIRPMEWSMGCHTTLPSGGNANLPGDNPWDDFDTIRPMLRQLLIERFHLSVHAGSRQEADYGLFVAKGGARLKLSDHTIDREGQKNGDQPSNWISVSHVQGRGEKMSQVATLFSLVLREPVADHNRDFGSYNIDLDFAPLNSTDSTLPTFFSAVEDQLGLKLHPEQVTVPTLIIDHVDANPTPN